MKCYTLKEKEILGWNTSLCVWGGRSCASTYTHKRSAANVIPRVLLRECFSLGWNLLIRLARGPPVSTSPCRDFKYLPYCLAFSVDLGDQTQITVHTWQALYQLISLTNLQRVLREVSSKSDTSPRELYPIV